jgi:phenylacetate-CoA ligase
MIFTNFFRRYKQKKAIALLCKGPAERFERWGREKLPGVIRSAIAHSPAYRKVLKNSPVISGKPFTHADSIHQLPVLDKQSYFEKFSLQELAGKRAEQIKLAMTSSGFSGSFAYNFIPKKAIEKSQFGVDIAFDYCFNTSSKKTFLISCEPMGVHIDTSLPLAEVSVRSDMALALLKKVSPLYEQTIILGDPYFIKKLVEEGGEAGIPWEKLNVSLVTGQDWLPESLRTYLAERIGIDPDADTQRSILTTMGMTELGINVFHETLPLVRLRREIARNSDLRKRLFESEMKAPPMIYHYYPFRNHIGIRYQGNLPEMVFTSLDTDAIVPVIRYSTGDSGAVLSYSKLVEILSSDYPKLIPELKLPVGIIFGRLKNRIQTAQGMLHMEDIREALFSDKGLAASFTGLAGLDTSQALPALNVHLKRNVNSRTALQKKTEAVLGEYLQREIRVNLLEYHHFPNALELSYEHKLYAR